MHCHCLLVISVLTAGVLFAHLATPTTPLWGDIRVMHTWNTVPDNWESLGSPPAGTTIDLHIALKPQHENALIDALDEVSTPRHPKYGAHLSREKVAELVAPHQDTLKIVHSWLENHGVPSASISTSHGGGWLTITGVPVSKADELLCASYQLYRHAGTNETEVILRTVGYALPAVLHSHIETVAPTTYFASRRTQLQTPRKRSREEAAVVVNATSGEFVRMLSSPNYFVTPSFLRWLYRTQAYVPVAMNDNALGTLGFMGDNPTQADLTQFMTDFRANAVAATFTVVQVNGGIYDATQPGADANLQAQYAEAIAYPTPLVFYSTGGKFEFTSDTEPKPASGDTYLEWLKYLLVQPNLPATISISYANPESDLSREYARALCRLFAQLGARGVSVLAASGSDGVGRGDCINHRGVVQFQPVFPATCPYVTSVGGTTSHDPEVAADFSGGGFSKHFPRHLHQQDAVNRYLQVLGKKHDARYPLQGRAIPDIAAQAQRFVYIRDTVPHAMSGTICAVSTAAGIVSLLNDYLLSSDRNTLGYLNPWLYGTALGSFNDITTGSNPGCNTDGFSATDGWDPVTGLGTLDFEILQLVLKVDLEIDD